MEKKRGQPPVVGWDTTDDEGSRTLDEWIGILWIIAAISAAASCAGLLYTYTWPQADVRWPWLGSFVDATCHAREDPKTLVQANETKTLAFVFMCISRVHHLALWERFFEGHEARYNVYFHCSHDATQGFVKRHAIPERTAGSSGIASIQALYKHAARDNNYKTVLLCSESIPLKSFDYVYNYLTLDDKSYMKYQSLPIQKETQSEKRTLLSSYSKWLECARRVPRFMFDISISEWRYGEPWTILNAKHSRMLYEDERVMPILDGCNAAEHYAPYVLSLNGELQNVVDVQTMHSRESHFNKGEGGIFHGASSRTLKLYDTICLADIEEFSQSDVLFGRRFSTSSDIAHYIPTLWASTPNDGKKPMPVPMWYGGAKLLRRDPFCFSPASEATLLPQRLAQQRSCAVVGSSGLLATRLQGSSIDSKSNFVIRSNANPWGGQYTAMVGRRADLQLVNCPLHTGTYVCGGATLT